MQIQRIRIKNFRNYEEQEIHFHPRLNVIYGNNAQGKTNILEAIYVCATSRSHRTSIFKEMIQMNHDEAHVQLLGIKENEPYEIDVHLRSNNKKNIAINHVSIKKMNELLGIIPIIMFSPEDLSLIKSGPKERRRFIDIELSQLDGVYYYYLQKYHLLLKHRNALLKNSYGSEKECKEQLEIWDLQFLEYGKKVIDMRSTFINELNLIYQKRHFQISGGKESMNILYEMNVTSQEFEEKLKRNVDRDMKQKSTSVGPHRDDLLFDLNGVDLRKYGSQGQQRTAALSLKLSEIELIQVKREEKPILLLDDVLSELDESRQRYLMNNIQEIQTFITCTGIEDFILKEKENKSFFKVEDGVCNNSITSL